MKHLIIIFLLIFFPTQAQVLEGSVTDFETGEKLPFANISILDKNFGVSSNDNGLYKIEIPEKYREDSLLVSFVGYQNKIISLTDYKPNQTYTLHIRLQKENELLEEVTITNEKVEYKATPVTVGTNRKGTFITSVPFGHETATLIKNEKRKPGKLEELRLKLKKKENELYKVYPCYYRISFYSNNPRNQIGNLLSYENIVIQPENKNQTFRINLEEYQIKFPANGLFVGIETINPKTELPKSNMYLTTPNILYTHTEESLSYTRFRGNKWTKKKRKSPLKNNLFSVPLIELKVVFEK